MTSTVNETRWCMPRDPVHVHFDCFSGAAGDMLLGACLDASGDAEELLKHVHLCLQKGLPEIADDFDIQIKRVQRGKMASIAALYVSVTSRYQHAPAPIPQADAGFSSTHEHSHKHSHDHGHGHSHSGGEHEHYDSNDSSRQKESKSVGDESTIHHGHSHVSDDHHHSHEHLESQTSNHTHDHTHDHHTTIESDSHDHGHASSTTSPGPLRNFPQIRDMLLKAPEQCISHWVQDTAIRAFEALAYAEAKTHGASSIESVHFHEVGAIDSIVDTVGTLIALQAMNATTSFSCSRIPLGEGTCWGMHGCMPVPAPATLRLLQDMPVCRGPPGVTGELVTPTGAALLKALCGGSSSPQKSPSFTLRRIGIGAGTKDFEKHPNIVRVLIGDNVEH